MVDGDYYYYYYSIPHILLLLQFLSSQKSFQTAETASEIIQSTTDHKFLIHSSNACLLPLRRNE